MSEAFTGQIVMFGGTFAPKNWHFCDGSLLQIQQFSALYSLLGVAYGGDGRTTFALPDLRSRVPVGQGTGTGLSNWTLGQKGGVENVTLTTSQMPTHNHNLVGSSAAATTDQPGNNYLADSNDGAGGGINSYATSQNGTNLGNTSIGAIGGGQGHTNIQPSLGINFIICLNGVFPSRN